METTFGVSRLGFFDWVFSIGVFRLGVGGIACYWQMAKISSLRGRLRVGLNMCYEYINKISNLINH